MAIKNNDTKIVPPFMIQTALGEAKKSNIDHYMKDLTWLKLGNKALRAMPSSPRQKAIIAQRKQREAEIDAKLMKEEKQAGFACKNCGGDIFDRKKVNDTFAKVCRNCGHEHPYKAKAPSKKSLAIRASLAKYMGEANNELPPKEPKKKKPYRGQSNVDNAIDQIANQGVGGAGLTSTQSATV
jgi:predicted RNA-binding Zn-ribbon protein involved in translation (DUF1610 family)